MQSIWYYGQDVRISECVFTQPWAGGVSKGSVGTMKTVAGLKSTLTVGLRGGYGAGYGVVKGPLSRPRNRQPG